MSTILRALEKANKSRNRDAQPGDAVSAAAAATRERQLREEAERHRRTARYMAVLFIVCIVIVAGIVSGMMLMREDGSTASRVASVPDPQPVQNLQGTPPPAENSEPVDTGTGTVLPTPTPAPSPTPQSSPTPTPLPTATPTPEPTATPEASLFRNNQVVWPEDLGIQVQGVLEDGSNSLIMIDHHNVEIGRKFKGIRPLAVRDGMIEAEYDQPGGEITLFIRY